MYKSRRTTRICFSASFFLIYINDLATDLKPNVKIFADDTSLFSIVSDPLETANILIKVLIKFEAGLNIDPDPTKQTEEVAFSKKNPQESSHPNLYFRKFVVEKVQTLKHYRA